MRHSGAHAGQSLRSEAKQFNAMGSDAIRWPSLLTAGEWSCPIWCGRVWSCLAWSYLIWRECCGSSEAGITCFMIWLENAAAMVYSLMIWSPEDTRLWSANVPCQGKD